jgi:hypothetical protein
VELVPLVRMFLCRVGPEGVGLTVEPLVELVGELEVLVQLARALVVLVVGIYSVQGDRVAPILISAIRGKRVEDMVLAVAVLVLVLMVVAMEVLELQGSY